MILYRRVSCFTVLLALAGASTARADYATEVLADSPLAYWRFEDGAVGQIMSGFEPAADATAAHPGTYLWAGLADGPQLASGVPGIGQTAVHFVRGTNAADGDYIQFDTLGNFASSIDDSGATFEFWVRNLQGNLTSNRLFGVTNERPGGARKTQISFGFEDLQDRFGGPADSVFVRDDNDDAWSYMIDNSEVDIKDGNWHHVAWVIDPGIPTDGTRIYLDGQLVTFVPAGSDATTNLTPKPLSNFADFDKAFLLGAEHGLGSVPGSFTLNAMVDEFAVYGRALSAAEIESHLVGVPVATQFQWKSDVLASWHGSNWTAVDGVLASRPNSNQATAVLGSAITQARTVVIQSDVTVKSLHFDNAQSYAVAGPGALNLEADTGNAAIEVFQGNHQLQTAVNLHDNAVANIEGGTTLEINNRLNLNGNTLTKTGAGTLTINNIVTLDGGTLVGTSGSIGGGGTILGDVENTGGTMAPGNSPGTLTIVGNYSQGTAATLFMEIAADRHDLLRVSGNASLNGALVIRLLNGYTLKAGDEFNLLDFGSVSGAFNEMRFAPLGPGLRWNTSRLYSAGSLSVAVVPEPAALWLLTIGCALLSGIRRRTRLAAMTIASAVFGLVGFSTTARADYATTVLADNPVSYWRFEDGSVGAILNNAPAADATGNHPGTYLAAGAADGPQLVTGAPGIGGTAAHFVGTSSTVGDYIRFTTLGDAGSNIDNNGLTFEFLMKNAGQSTGSNRIFGVSNDRPAAGAAGRRLTMSFGFQDLNLNVVDHPGVGDTLFLRDDSDQAWAYRTDTGGVNIEDGNWHHVVWVIDPGVPAGGTRFYVDGNLVALGAATGLFAPKAASNFSNFDKDFVLGAENIFNGTPSTPGGLVRTFAANSILDEFAVYSAALTPEQIANHVAEITATIYDWKTSGFGDWASGANWAGLNGVIGGLPNSNKHTAVFGSTLATPTTIVTETTVTVKELQFDNASTVIAGNGSVQLQADAGSASIQVAQGIHQFQADVDLASSTTANVAAGASIEFNNRLDLNGNTLTKSGDGTLLVNNNQNSGTGSVNVTDGVLGGGGRIGGNLTNSSGGTVAPGASPGILSVQGNYVQQAGGTLSIELGGLAEGEEFDVLNVTGSITLNGGVLNVSLIDGFNPTNGDSFDILDFGSISGNFTTLNLQGGAASWNTTQLLTTGIITFTGSIGIAGDYNGDGVVNAADYAVWRDSLSPSVTPGSGADGTGDGIVNQADYTFWRSRFGATSGSGAGSASIPEPTSAVLLFAFLFAARIRVVRFRRS